MKVLYVFLAYCVLLSRAEPPCPSCSFAVHPDNETDCSVYSFVSDEVVPWYRANESCLKSLNISIAAVDKRNMWNMCPSPNPGQDGDLNRLINLLRDSNGDASRAVKSQFEYFFRPADANATSYNLPDSILDQNDNAVDCNSSTLCWSVIKLYFGLHDEAIATACGELHSMQRKSLLEEQGIARDMICELVQQQEIDIPEDCTDLGNQIKSIVESAGATCEEIQNSSADVKLPICEVESKSGARGAASWTFVFAIVGLVSWTLK